MDHYESLYQIFKAKSKESPLLQAARLGNIDLILHIISKKDEQVREVDEDGFSALYFVIQENHIFLSQLLAISFSPFHYECQHDRDIIALARNHHTHEMDRIVQFIIQDMYRNRILDQASKTLQEIENEQFVRELIQEDEETEKKLQQKRDKKRAKKQKAKLRKQTEHHITSSQPVSLNTPDFTKFGDDKPIRKGNMEEVIFEKLVKIGHRSGRYRRRQFLRNKKKKKVVLTTIRYVPRTHFPSISLKQVKEPIRIFRRKRDKITIPTFTIQSGTPLLGWPLYEKRWMERLQRYVHQPIIVEIETNTDSLFTYRNDHALGMFQPSIFF